MSRDTTSSSVDSTHIIILLCKYGFHQPYEWCIPIEMVQNLFNALCTYTILETYMTVFTDARVCTCMRSAIVWFCMQICIEKPQPETI